MCYCNTYINAAPDQNSYREMKAQHCAINPMPTTDRTGRLCWFGVTDHKGCTWMAQSKGLHRVISAGTSMTGQWRSKHAQPSCPH